MEQQQATLEINEVNWSFKELKFLYPLRDAMRVYNTHTMKNQISQVEIHFGFCFCPNHIFQYIRIAYNDSCRRTKRSEERTKA